MQEKNITGLVNLAASLAMVWASSAGAVQVNISGTVVDTRNQPVNGATVRLALNASLSTTTNALGAYTLQGETSGTLRPAAGLRPASETVVRNGAVIMSLDAAQTVSIAGYSPDGRCIDLHADRHLSSGTHRIPLAVGSRAISLVRVRSGDKTVFLKAGPASAGSPLRNPQPGMAKTAAILDSLVIVHPYYDTAYTAVSAFSGTVNDTLTFKTIDSGAVFRMLSPNGGEVYNYGDTITSCWLQRINRCRNGMLTIVNSFNYCDYFSQAIESRLAWPRDTTPNNEKYFVTLEDSCALAVVQIILTDKPGSGCNVTFGGSEMRFRAYDEYAPVGCQNCWDYSDAEFTVVKP